MTGHKNFLVKRPQVKTPQIGKTPNGPHSSKDRIFFYLHHVELICIEVLPYNGHGKQYLL